MKKLIIILFLLIGISSYSQTRLGYSYSQIKNEFSLYPCSTGINEWGVFWLQVELDGCTVVYGFDDSYICNSSIIIPDNQGMLNTYVQNYNNQYVIISQTEWNMYSSGGILRIQLFYTEDGGYYFLWTRKL
jgi:hypothetical protein